MSRIGKFIVLIIVGFALGGALAYFTQQPASTDLSQAPATEQAIDAATAAATNDDTAMAVDGAPAMPAIEEGVAADASTTSASPAETVVSASPDNAMVGTAPPVDETAGVAGSSVGGAFVLKDFNGVEVTEKSWPGKMKLVFFGFTNCPDICPAALEKVTAALKTTGTDKVQPIFITVDPARDTAEAMKEYLAKYDPAYTGLTGTEEQLKAAQDAYKVYASKQDPVSPEHAEHYNVDHSGYIYLIGENEQLLEIFGKDATADAIAAAISKHAAGTSAPAREGTVVPETAPFASAEDMPDADAPVESAPETPAGDMPPQPE